MHVVIAGGSGFLGSYLCSKLSLQQTPYKVTLLTHSDVDTVQTRLAKRYSFGVDTRIISYDDYKGEGDVLLNFAGESMGAKQISTRRLHALLNSRLDVIEKLSKCETLPKIFVQASGVSVYSNSVDPQDEGAPDDADNDIAKMARSIEERARQLNEQFKFEHFYIARFGIIMHRSGGIMRKAAQMPPFTVIHGDNHIPFIELNDACAAIKELFTGKIPSGVVNMCAPHSATLKELLNCIYKTSALPQIPVITGFLRSSDRRMLLLSCDQNIVPQALYNVGFKFMYNKVQDID